MEDHKPRNCGQCCYFSFTNVKHWCSLRISPTVPTFHYPNYAYPFCHRFTKGTPHYYDTYD